MAIMLKLWWNSQREKAYIIFILYLSYCNLTLKAIMLLEIEEKEKKKKNWRRRGMQLEEKHEALRESWSCENSEKEEAKKRSPHHAERRNKHMAVKIWPQWNSRNAAGPKYSLFTTVYAYFRHALKSCDKSYTMTVQSIERIFREMAYREMYTSICDREKWLWRKWYVKLLKKKRSLWSPEKRLCVAEKWCL